MKGLQVALLAASVIGGLAGAGLARAEMPEAEGQWWVWQEGDANAAFTRLGTGERLGMLCAPGVDDCAAFLAPGWACEVGKPLLVRVEGEAGILRLGGDCRATALGPVVVFGNDLAQFLRGSPSIEVSLVSPAKERVTLRFSNEGAARAMARVQAAHAERRAASGAPAEAAPASP